VRRLRPLLAGLALLALLVAAAPAAGHAVLVDSAPAAEARLSESPDAVVLRFNEPVELLSAQDLDVVDKRGENVTTTLGRRVAGDATAVEVLLRPGLAEGTYTVRYRVIGADSHVIPGVVLFGVGQDELSEPVLAGGAAGAGPSETGAWSVSARFIELIAIGGLAGLMAFRWLVWRVAWRSPVAPGGDGRRRGLTWGRDVFWIAFGVLAIAGVLAEGYLLVVHSASALGTGVIAAAGNPAGLSDVLRDTRFGGLLQVRAALLVLVFVLGAFLLRREYTDPNGPSPAGSAVGAGVVSVAIGAVLWQLSVQGHPSQAPLPWLSTGAHFVHLLAVAVWIAGIALVGLTLWQLPREVPDGGAAAATAVLSRFSRVALVAVAVAVVTGVARTVGQLDDPAQLWETAYGRTILVKLALLCPIALLALRNRRVVTALDRLRRPNRVALAIVRRAAGIELALALVVVVAASLLVAEVPGRV
jgi:copper transport protein